MQDATYYRAFKRKPCLTIPMPWKQWPSKTTESPQQPTKPQNKSRTTLPQKSTIFSQLISLLCVIPEHRPLFYIVVSTWLCTRKTINPFRRLWTTLFKCIPLGPNIKVDNSTRTNSSALKHQTWVSHCLWFFVYLR